MLTTWRHPQWSRGVPFRVLPRTPRRLRTWGSPRGGPACPGDSPGGPLQPVTWFLCIGRPGGYTLPPPCRLPGGRPDRASPIVLSRESSGPRSCPPPHRRRQPWPLGQPLTPRRLPPDPQTVPYPRFPCATWSSPGSLRPCRRPMSLWERRGKRRGVSRSLNSVRAPPAYWYSILISEENVKI